MRCSLLTLSSYLDKELSPERSGEVDAHIIGCARCRTALGYLQEESERIGSLAHAHVAEQAAQQLFVQLGLIEAPLTEASPWLGEATGKALPWAPREPVPSDLAAPPLDEISVGDEPITTQQRSDYDAFDIHDVYIHNAHIEEAYVEDAHVEGAHVEEAHVELQGFAAPPAAPPSLGPPQPAARSAMPGFVHRFRDAISVRLALMRGSTAELDDSVNIVSNAAGAAAPHHVEGGEALSKRLGQYGEAAPTSPASPSRQAATAVMEAPPRVEDDEFSFVPSAHPIAPPQPPAPRPAAPGRHLRSLGSGGRISKPSWLSLAPVTRRTHSVAMGGPAVGVPARDGRLWIFGGAVVVLMLIGLLAGKSVSSLPVAGTQPQPSFHPSTAPSANAGQPSLAPATAVPTPAPTPRPTPAPPPSPALLSGAQTLGAGTTGYQILDVRYGTHPGDFRIVFDMGNTSQRASGAPKVTMGFGNTTTLYVEFFRVVPAGSIPEPAAGNTVTSVRLLSPSPLPGRTIYQFNLAHAVTLSGYYLAGPTRLVIDLSS